MSFIPRVLPAALFVLGACANGSSPPVAPASTAEPVAPPPAPVDTSAADARAAETCLLTAAAKRARSSAEPAKVTVKHVLVKHKTAKHAPPGVTRTREEACLRAMEVRDKIRAGADFDLIVKEYSDEPGAATLGGALGSVERKDLEKPFADAAFELGVNQLSDVVETDYGFHVIVRTR